MENQEETFKITLQINAGMEPTTLMVFAEENSALSPHHELVFRVTRDKDSEGLAVLMPDGNHCWQLLEGEMEEKEVTLIGAAIDDHYA